MSENCGHWSTIGKMASGACKVLSKGGGIVGKIASTAVCSGVGKAATAACEKVSHCSTTKSAEWFSLN